MLSDVYRARTKAAVLLVPNPATSSRIGTNPLWEVVFVRTHKQQVGSISKNNYVVIWIGSFF